MNCSIITTTYSMKTHENLFSSLHTWITLDFNEIIIVDWCSKINFEEVLPSYFKIHKNFDKIKIYYIKEYDKYIPTWAFNFGMNMSQSEYIFKIDSNFSLNSNFFKINTFNFNQVPVIYFDENQFVCKRIYLEKVGYLNEKILDNNYISDLILKLDKEYSYSYKFIIKELYGLFDIIDTKEIILLPIQFKKKNDVYVINSISNKITTELISEKRFIVLKLYNGIGNRLKTLLTTIHFAKKYNYKLYVIWEKTQGFSDSKFEDYFIYEGDKTFEFISSSDISNIDFEYTYYFKQDNKNIQKFDLSYNKIYVECYYKLEILFSMSTPSKDLSKEEKALYKNIKPNTKIKIVIDYIKKYILNSDYKYNIYHIRRGDATNKFNKDRDKTYIWSSIYMFAKYINQNKNKQNLVLTDDYDYCKKFLDVLCKDKYITINETNLNKNVLHIDSKIFTIQDVVDLYLFENAEKVFETYWSTFSDTGIHMFDIKESHTVVDKNLYLEIKNDDLEYKSKNDIIFQYIPYCTFWCNYENLYTYLKNSSKYCFKTVFFQSIIDKYENLKNIQNMEDIKNRINILTLNDDNKDELELEKYIITSIYNNFYK
jgi:hypothetical protein